MGKVGTIQDIVGLSKAMATLGTEEELRYCLIACLRLARANRDRLIDSSARSTHPGLARLGAYLRYITSSDRVCERTLDIVQRKVKWNDYLYRMFLVRDVPLRKVQLRLRDLAAEKQKHTLDRVVRVMLSEVVREVNVNLMTLGRSQ